MTGKKRKFCLFCYDDTNVLWRFSPEREGDVKTSCGAFRQREREREGNVKTSCGAERVNL